MKNDTHNSHHQNDHHYSESSEEIKGALSKKGMIWNIITIVVIIGLLASWWYGFGKSYAAVKSATISAKTGIASVFHLSKADTSTESDSDVSISDAIDGTNSSDALNSSLWESRKANAGESVWSTYASDIKSNDGIAYKNQVINGLKNITILQNNIDQNKLSNNSITQGKDYSFISKDAQEKFASKVTEANKQLESGKNLKDLDNSLSLAYQVANPSSYSYVYSLQISDIQQLLQ